MPTLKELLKEVIPLEYIDLVPTSFDLIGSKAGQVAILRLDERLEKYEKVIAEAIKKIHKNVKAVVSRSESRKGEFRLYEYKLVIGEDTEVIHKEYGYILKLDPLKVYFSPRDAEDRVDIAKSTKEGERILYLFSGIAPYAVAIAKLNPKIGKIICVEKNEIAHKYAIENIKLNKIEDKVECINADVKDVLANYQNYADRVLMTLPLGAHEFLGPALSTLKEEGGIIHFYHVEAENSLFVDAIRIIEETCKAYSYSYEIIKKRVVSDYAPRKYKVRIDFFAKKLK